jgi:transposase
MYVLRTGIAWRDVPAGTVGCSGVTAWRRLRDRTEAGVWPRLHAVLLAELRRADLLDLDRIRYERRADLHQGLLELACSLVCLRRLRTSR